jgi:hypothetical protein
MQDLANRIANQLRPHVERRIWVELFKLQTKHAIKRDHLFEGTSHCASMPSASRRFPISGVVPSGMTDGSILNVNEVVRG